MATFFLVHGAWHGAWCWAELRKLLHKQGHETHAITLTGLGERSHLAHAEINADTHVLDVTNAFKWRELEDVILVGHSYGGTIITGVAGQIPARIKALVYLDAMVPLTSDESLFANGDPKRIAGFKRQLKDGGFLLEPDLFDAWTDSPEKKAWLKSLCTPHPVECFRSGVTLTGREVEVQNRYYILAERNYPSKFWEYYEKYRHDPSWKCGRVATKHDVMVEDAPELAGMLDQYSREIEA